MDQIRPKKETAMPDKKAQRRKQAIAQYLAGDKIEDICETMACAKSWRYTWRDRSQANDPYWAKERTKRPKSPPPTIPESIELAVGSLHHTLSRNGPGHGAASLKQALG